MTKTRADKLVIQTLDNIKNSIVTLGMVNKRFAIVGDYEPAQYCIARNNEIIANMKQILAKMPMLKNPAPICSKTNLAISALMQDMTKILFGKRKEVDRMGKCKKGGGKKK